MKKILLTAVALTTMVSCEKDMLQTNLYEKSKNLDFYEANNGNWVTNSVTETFNGAVEIFYDGGALEISTVNIHEYNEESCGDLFDLPVVSNTSTKLVLSWGGDNDDIVTFTRNGNAINYHRLDPIDGWEATSIYTAGTIPNCN